MAAPKRMVDIKVQDTIMSHEHYVWFDRYHDYQPLLMWCMVNYDLEDWSIHTWYNDMKYDKRGFSFSEREEAFKFMLRFGGDYEHRIHNENS